MLAVDMEAGLPAEDPPVEATVISESTWLDYEFCCRSGLTMAQTARRMNVSKGAVLMAAEKLGLRFRGDHQKYTQVCAQDVTLLARDQLEFEVLVLRMRLSAAEGGVEADEIIRELDIRKGEARVFQILYRNLGGLVSKSSIMDWMYAHDPDPPGEKVLDVWVCKLRKALKNSKFQIETRWGLGWAMSIRKEAV